MADPNAAPKLDRYKDERGNLFSLTAEEAERRGYELASGPVAEPEAAPAAAPEEEPEPDAKARVTAPNKARSSAADK